MLVVVGTNQICNTHLYILPTNVLQSCNTFVNAKASGREQMGEAFLSGIEGPPKLTT
jgi:hypothetical protein